jgi:6-phosphogluconolactonase/glucosamine-6-phosphate isomerase/deaminase
MGIRLEVAEDGDGAAGRVHVALSGGTTPMPMFRALAALDAVRWSDLELWQVDERLGAAGPDRNAGALAASGLVARAAAFHPMDVEGADPEAAARAYAAMLPPRFTAIHLGLGDDGHTASLVPGDPVAATRDRAVAVTATYRGFRRLTLTAPVLEDAGLAVFLVLGAGKRDAIGRLLAGDASIPAGAIRYREAVVVADRAAAGDGA